MMEAYARGERWLLAAVTAVVLGVAGLHLRSEVAPALSSGTPLNVLVMPRASGPFLLLQWRPVERRLRAISLDPSTAVDSSEARTMGELAGVPPRRAVATVEALFKGATARLMIPHWLRWDPPVRGLPNDDFALAWSKGALPRWSRSPRALLALPAALRRAAREERSDLSTYDLLLLALDFQQAEGVAAAIPAGREVKGRFEALPASLEGLKSVFLAARTEPPAAAPTAEVLNASGKPGLAQDATKVLRLNGIDVVNFGNAGGSRPRTLIVDRTGRRADAEKARRALGSEADLLTEPDPSRLAQVSVLLGESFAAARK